MDDETLKEVQIQKVENLHEITGHLREISRNLFLISRQGINVRIEKAYSSGTEDRESILRHIVDQVWPEEDVKSFVEKMRLTDRKKIGTLVGSAGAQRYAQERAGQNTRKKKAQKKQR